MINAASSYSRLLPIRSAVFPTFDIDQEAAAKSIVACVAEHVTERRIELVIELGCGTAEILSSVRQQLTAMQNRQINGTGVDCCAAEIAVAREVGVGCEFRVERAEDFMRSLVCDEGYLESQRALLMCVGHTISHFQDMVSVLDDIARWGPALLLIDFHEGWDEVVHHFDLPDAPPVRQLKRVRDGADGARVRYMLTSKQDPAESGRLLRGIEMDHDGRDASILFWTTQLRKPSEWFLAEMNRRGYVAVRTLQYKAGYGPMTGFLLARQELSR